MGNHTVSVLNYRTSILNRFCPKPWFSKTSFQYNVIEVVWFMYCLCAVCCKVHGIYECHHFYFTVKFFIIFWFLGRWITAGFSMFIVCFVQHQWSAFTGLQCFVFDSFDVKSGILVVRPLFNQPLCLLSHLLSLFFYRLLACYHLAWISSSNEENWILLCFV